MPFPLDAARFPPPFVGGGRAQTTAPSGLLEKVPRISGSFRASIARQSLLPNQTQMPLHALCGKKRRRVCVPAKTSEKTSASKKLPSSELREKSKKYEKNLPEKLAQEEKGCTFAPALTAKFLSYWRHEKGEKKSKIFSSKSLPEIKKGFTFAPRRTGVHWEIE